MKTDKELYRQLRVLSCDKLWNEEVARFDQATPKERMQRVAVIRAVGVVFAASGTTKQRAEVKAWLTRLLKDPSEKIRRYAMAALPKIGAGRGEEAELLSLLKTTTGDREKKHLGRALDKIGGAATLDVVAGTPGFLPQTEQKVKASVARKQKPSTVRLDRVISDFARLRIHLRCRKGLEKILRDEVDEYIAKHGKFRVIHVASRLIELAPVAAFSLADLYTLRCFATMGFVLGTVPGPESAASTEALAKVITSPLARNILTTLTEGSVRYRIDFVSKGHQRGAVHLLANRAYELCPEILNDARQAPWSMDVYPSSGGFGVELRPRLYPDPRLSYRQDDVSAASHPPLAACMAKLAGKQEGEVVWDPFCGSGLELVERALLGGVKRVYGTDISREAVAIAAANFAAAKLSDVKTKFVCCDFRDQAAMLGLSPGSVTLMITNPPMGRRVRVPGLHRLFEDLFAVAAIMLKPGGRLVFANPLSVGPKDPSLKLQYQQVVDLGGFDCQLEMYVKQEG